MIKAKLKFQQGDSHVYLLGLTAKDIEHLKNDNKICLDLSELSLPGMGKICITYGETEYDIETALRSAGAKPSKPF